MTADAASAPVDTAGAAGPEASRGPRARSATAYLRYVARQAGGRGRVAVRRTRHQLLPVPADPRRPGEVHDRRTAGLGRATGQLPRAVRARSAAVAAVHRLLRQGPHRRSGNLVPVQRVGDRQDHRGAAEHPAAHRHGLRDLHPAGDRPRHAFGVAARAARRPAGHRARADAVLGAVVLAGAAADRHAVGRGRTAAGTVPHRRHGVGRRGGLRVRPGRGPPSGAAGGDAGGRRVRADAAGDPVGAAGRDGQRLSDHRPRQGPARRPRPAASRGAERAAADRDADLHQSGPHGGRGDPGGDGVLLAGPRRAVLPGAERARSAAGAGAVPRVRRRGDRDEHRGRSDLSAARPRVGR